MITRSAFVAVAFAVSAASGLLPGQVRAAGDLVAFPENYAEGVRYTTVERGNIREEIFTSRAAVEAVKEGRPLPGGTVITLVDYRDGKLFRYVVMEKRSGWGVDRPPESRNGEWEYQAFGADRTVNRGETLDRCFACHKSQAGQDFVFTLDRMRGTR
ncbi:cytochrome P460 family protein [Rhodoplanes sp. SY1]|uniref:cytochrome P460 family protein n=1 Tax=Rhodoplanes sp. SY1 TaxID=3166646 RepID=UPI0038B514C1